MTERAFADRVLLPVTAAIYQNGKRNQQCVGLWELGLKVTRSCSILLVDFWKDMVSLIDAASWKYQNLKSQSAWEIFERQKFLKTAIQVSMEVRACTPIFLKAYEAFYKNAIPIPTKSLEWKRYIDNVFSLWKTRNQQVSSNRSSNQPL